MINANYFSYNSVSSQTYHLKIAEFSGITPNPVEESGAFSPTLTLLRTPKSVAFYHGGIQYTEAPKCEFSVVSEEEITLSDRASILGWLLGKSEFAPLVFYGGGLEAYTYYCVFTSVSTIYVNGICHGFKLTATLDSPYARGVASSVSGSSGTQTLTINNSSSVPGGYVYPMVEFNGTGISIINQTDSATRAFVFEDLESEEHMTVDCEKKTIRGTLGGGFGNFTSKNWLRLLPGVNTLNVTAHGSFTITCPTYEIIGL